MFNWFKRAKVDDIEVEPRFVKFCMVCGRALVKCGPDKYDPFTGHGIYEGKPLWFCPEYNQSPRYSKDHTIIRQDDPNENI